jgi:tripartite-type tricarboxylate transporter receptor subunit TctC
MMPQPSDATRPGPNPLHRRSLLPLAALSLLPALPAAAQSWPSRPIKVVVPFPPGGATDLIARLVAEHLGPVLGQQVVIENRAGANGAIGCQAVATAPPDGHTLLAGAPGILAVNPWVMKALPYDPERDFAGVSMIASIPYVMAIPPSVPARSVAEFIALVKRNPGQYNFATSGTSSRLTVEMFRAMAGGLDMTMVQYRGGAPARIDLLRGDVQLVIDQMPSFLEDFRKGELVPLAVGTRTRSALLPDVPTMMEAGLPDYEAWAWLAYAAPSRTPRAVINRLSEEIGRVLGKPEVLARLASWGSEPVGCSPEEMDRMVSAERSRWGEVVRLAGIEKE